jgi:hypothetical protein
MPRMLGTCQRPWCPYHRSKGFGLDCPDVSRCKGAARAAEKRGWRREAALADEFAPFAAESLEWAEATWAAVAESWPEYADPAASGCEARRL